MLKFFPLTFECELVHVETKADSGLKKKERRDKECQEESADRVEGLLSDGVDIASGHTETSLSTNTTCCNSLKSILCREC